MIARAPLDGQYYLADSRRVHNLLTGYLQGEQSESWIRSIARYQDGRRDMIALRRHYAGEGNSTHRIGDAKRIQSTLHYKSERALPFNKFLDSLQKMFTIFEEENEPLSERAKVDELLTKVQNTSLSAAVAQLRFQLNTEGVTFTVAANHLNSAVSQTTDYQMARKINATNTNDRQQEEDAVDAAIVEAGKEEEAAEAVAVVLAAEVADHLETEARAVVRIPTITRLPNGTNYPLKNVTRFARSVIRKANKADPNDRLAIYQWNNLKQ